MHRSLACAVAFALTALVAAPVLAQGSPSAKHAVVYDDEVDVLTGTDWHPILVQSLKTANAKGLAIHVSLECGLATPTFVKSKGERVESTASAEVRVQVKVDGVPIGGGEDYSVAFCSRTRKTTAAFSGIFTAPENETCFTLVDPGTGEPAENLEETVVRLKPDCLADEDLALLEDSLSAHSYLFYYDDTAPGDHEITVEAKIAGDVDANGKPFAVVKKGSLLIEQIRLAHDAVIEMD